MARLIAITAYAVDSTTYASASPMAIGTDSIVNIQNATLTLKKQFPSASANINTRIRVNTDTNNEGEAHVYLVSETIAALVTASA